MDQALLVYKVDNPVKSSLLSSLVLPSTRLPHNPTLRVLSYNNLVFKFTIKYVHSFSGTSFFISFPAGASVLFFIL